MPRYGLALQTAATSEPLTDLEARKQCELGDNGAHDEHLRQLITAARQVVETETGRQLINATWDLYLDEFPVGLEPIKLPKSPLSSVTSITYTDNDGVSQTWSSANYIVSTNREPGLITPAYQVVYPATRGIRDAIRVRFVAGYGATAASVPEGLKQAMKLLIGHWFAHREEVITGTIQTEIDRGFQSLIANYRVGDEFTCYGRESYVTASTYRS